MLEMVVLRSYSHSKSFSSRRRANPLKKEVIPCPTNNPFYEKDKYTFHSTCESGIDVEEKLFSWAQTIVATMKNADENACALHLIVETNKKL